MVYSYQNERYMMVTPHQSKQLRNEDEEEEPPGLERENIRSIENIKSSNSSTDPLGGIGTWKKTSHDSYFTVSLLVTISFLVGLMVATCYHETISDNRKNHFLSHVIAAAAAAETVNSDETKCETSSIMRGDQNAKASTVVISESGLFHDISNYHQQDLDSLTIAAKMYWFCDPKDSNSCLDGGEKAETNGAVAAGTWWVNSTTGSFTIVAPAKKDFWRKTYYNPPFIKDDGPFLFTRRSVVKQQPQRRHESDSRRDDESSFFMLETAFTLRAVRQFDQAGLMIRLDHQHWIKAGIEVVDQQPRLSAVVTNSYSDWSTQDWYDFTRDKESDSLTAAVVVNCRLRVHVRGSSIVVEAQAPSPLSSPSTTAWQFVRIAHLDKEMGMRTKDHFTALEQTTHNGPDPPPDEMWVGVFAASPEDQSGSSVTFHHFRIIEGSSFEHNADGNQ